MQLVKIHVHEKFGKNSEKKENTVFRINPGKAISFLELQTVGKVLSVFPNSEFFKISILFLEAYQNVLGFRSLLFLILQWQQIVLHFKISLAVSTAQTFQHCAFEMISKTKSDIMEVFSLPKLRPLHEAIGRFERMQCYIQAFHNLEKMSQINFLMSL